MEISKIGLVMGICLVAAAAQGATTYTLTMTNGGAMPLSPAVIYVKNGQKHSLDVGQIATKGFVQLCQTGNPAVRAAELMGEAGVTFSTRTMAPLMPGESRTVEVEVTDPTKQSLHFETMYGKTKDTCGVGAVNGHSLTALLQHATSEVIGKDDVLVTGAFEAPIVPLAQSYACAQAKDAVSCLRELAAPAMMSGKIRFAPAYLPSVLDFLETKYGATDVGTLVIPAGGAIRVSLTLKH